MNAATAGAERSPVSGSAQPATATLVAHYSRSMGAVSAASPAQLSATTSDENSRHRLDAARYAAVKSEAKNSAPHADGASERSHDPLSASFAGMQSSAAICPPVGCNPPDMAVAASPKWIFQGVNTSFAVLDRSGVVQAGWPKFAGDFFGVPNPGACAGNVAFMSDPRAIYDATDDRFVAASLEIEGALGVNSCPFATRYWIAVSQTNDPRGAWNVYEFDMSLGTTNTADFTMIGIDDQGVYFSANMFTQAGDAYSYAEVFGANKAKMERGQSVVASGFFNLTVTGPAGTFLVDTVQPVVTLSDNERSRGEYFINSFNGFDPVSNHGCSSAADSCSGLATWQFTGVGRHAPKLDFAYVANTKAYSFAPSADQPTCNQCIDTNDLRISATPVYRDGVISAAWETGIDNGSQVVAGIVWSQVVPSSSDEGLGKAVQVQGGYFNLGGDDAVLYPALMPGRDGSLSMVFDHMGATTNPEVRLTSRRASRSFQAPGLLVKAGEGPYRPTRCGLGIPVCRWGDYSATSYDGDGWWFAGQYANAVTSFSRNWGTWIGAL